MPDAANPLANLLLIRLLMPGKKAPAAAALHKDLAPLFRGGLTKERVAEALNELRSAGLLPPKGQVLTDAGRGRALAAIGRTELPPKCNWGMIKAKFLVPQALGLTPWSEVEIARVNTADKLAARLLKAKFELPIAADTRLNGVLEALVCRLAGFPGCASFKELTAAVISREVHAEPPLPVKDAAKLAPRLLLGAAKSGIDGYRMKVLGGMFADRAIPAATQSEPHRLEAGATQSEPHRLEAGATQTDGAIPGGTGFQPVSPEPHRLEAGATQTETQAELHHFAERVNALAPTCPTGWAGDDLVLISHVWNHVHDRPEFHNCGLADFKGKLLAANRARLLSLSRADLVQALSPHDVQQSETAYLNSTFHFIKVRKRD